MQGPCVHLELLVVPYSHSLPRYLDLLIRIKISSIDIPCARHNSATGNYRDLAFSGIKDFAKKDIGTVPSMVLNSQFPFPRRHLQFYEYSY